MERKIETYIVDSFTNQPFKGNPAGVCILKNELQESTMLSIAKEFNHSETTFIKQTISSTKYSIRYFSPKMEIPLCGHATLAAAKVLFEKSPELNQIVFTNIEGIELEIIKEDDKIKMKFPVYDTIPMQVSAEMLTALGIKAIKNSAYNKETNILLLEIDNSLKLADLKPNFISLVNAHNSISGVLVTALSMNEEFDFESRYFWPWSGTNEDPVTGGTHTFLTKYWSDQLGKSKLRSFQCSERTGQMEVEIINENQLTISSNARILLQGWLSL